jgi:hypothetical protein
MGSKKKSNACKEALSRIRRICLSLPQTSEKLSHGEPTFFMRKRVFCMFANNHHNDGHVAVWIPTEPGLQATLLRSEPKKYFYPPYVGVSGWIGIELNEVSDEELAAHVVDAWKMMEAKQKKRTRARQR